MSMRRIAIMAATERELVPARACLRNVRDGGRQPFRHEVGEADGMEVHLIATGVGPEAAKTAARSALTGLNLDAVVSTGYAGALRPAGLGELIVGTDVLTWTADQPQARFKTDPALLSLARQVAGPRAGWSEGTLVTVEKVVWRACDKQALGALSGAAAVDMESAAIADAAASAGVPFLPVRAISDRVQDDLPMDFNLWFSPFGWLRCLLQILTRPSILTGLYDMKRHSEQASHTLQRFFGRLMAESPSMVKVS